MSQDISYSLGLNTTNFLGPLRAAVAGLTAFISVGAAVSIAMRGVYGAIQEGGRLVDLSAKTGVAVADLYRLQTAFEQVGLSAGDVPSLILRLQRAMATTSDSGTKAKELFGQMGLDLDQLKKLGAAEQLERVAGALSTMSRSSAVGVASKIFGREGFGQIMQITGDLEGFREGMQASAAAAAVFGQSAGAFDRLGDTLALLKMQGQGAFAGIATGLTPTIQTIVDALRSVDWVGIGKQIGAVTLGIGQAIQDGKLGELLNLSLSAGLEAFVQVFSQSVKLMANLLVSVLTNPGLFKAYNAGVMSAAAGGLAGALEAVGLDGAKSQQLRKLSKLSGQVAADTLTDSLPNFQKDLRKAFGSFKLEDTESGKKLKAFLGEMNARGQLNLAPTPGAPGGGLGESPQLGATPKGSEANALERIGFIFSGTGRGIQEQHLAATARNTGRTVTLLEYTQKSIEMSQRAGFAAAWAHL